MQKDEERKNQRDKWFMQRDAYTQYADIPKSYKIDYKDK